MELREIHWLMDMITHINVGLTVFSRDGKVEVWNHFMENHTGISSTEIKANESLFERIPELKAPWFQNKLEAVLTLQNDVFIGWEQVPHLLPLTPHRPVTDGVETMYQNISLNVLKQASGQSDLIVMMIYDTTEVALKKKALEDSNEQLNQISRTDPLTGINNRRHWTEQLDARLAQFKRYGNVCSLIMFDIDHFKRVNDNYGHVAGDQVIQMVATTAQSCIRELDCLGRYGGEEFGLLLPETDTKGALILAERIREKISAQAVSTDSNTDIQVTISLGIAELSEQVTTEESWLEFADQALYKSKENGRNRSTVYSQ